MQNFSGVAVGVGSGVAVGVGSGVAVGVGFSVGTGVGVGNKLISLKGMLFFPAKDSAYEPTFP